MKKTMVIAATTLLVLTGCATTAPTVTVTAQPVPSTEAPVVSNPREELYSSLVALGAPSWALTSDSMDILVGVAQDTCDAIDSGMSVEDIAMTAVLASEGADQEVVDVFLMATVAATYTYCPEYQGFFE